MHKTWMERLQEIVSYTYNRDFNMARDYFNKENNKDS